MHVPRWKQIANAICVEISEGRLASGDSLPSEIALAAQWQVSHMTAHRALHELQQQGIVVRKRRAGTVVAERRRRRTGHVAVFLNTGDFLEQEYLSGIRAGLPDECGLLCCDIRRDPQREAQYLERMQATTDGILCIPTCDPQNTERLNRLLQAGTNLVFVDCMPDGVEADAIISDNYGATLEALRFLAARGHRRIAYFTEARMSLSSLRERNAAYRQVMAELGVPDASPWVRGFPFDLTRNPTLPTQAVQDALFALLHLPERPSAVFCAHDYILSAVIQACRELGVSVPEDLEIVSFNDCPPFVPFLPGHIHRIVQRGHEIGKMAAEHLCNRLREEGRPPEIVRVAPVFHAAEAPASFSPD